MSNRENSESDWRERAAELEQLGLAWLEKGRYDAAARVLLEALGIWEDEGEPDGGLSVATYLGVALYEQGQHDKAVSVWEEILERGWKLPTVYALLARHYQGMGQPEQVTRITDALRSAGYPGASGAAPSAAPSEAAAADAGAAPPRILIADDEAGIRGLMGRFLSGVGYEVAYAEDGDATLDAILAGNCDLVVLDVYMPKQTGLDVLLRVRDEGHEIPVILISGFVDASLVEGGLALDAEFLAKPIVLSELGDLVKAKLAAAADNGGSGAVDPQG